MYNEIGHFAVIKLNVIMLSVILMRDIQPSFILLTVIHVIVIIVSVTVFSSILIIVVLLLSGILHNALMPG